MDVKEVIAVTLTISTLALMGLQVNSSVSPRTFFARKLSVTLPADADYGVVIKFMTPFVLEAWKCVESQRHCYR